MYLAEWCHLHTWWVQIWSCTTNPNYFYFNSHSESDTNFISKYESFTCVCLAPDVGADVLDMTGQGADTFGHLEHEDTYFDLSPVQRQFFASLQYLNEYLRNQYHAVHVFLWKSGFAGQAGNMPPRYDICLLHLITSFLKCLSLLFGPGWVRGTNLCITFNIQFVVILLYLCF